jgi:hypothetical protein
MSSEKKNATYSEEDVGIDDIDLDELAQNLQAQFDEQFEDLELLKEAQEQINDPENLGETVLNVVWDQVLNQVAITAGEDFIKENRGLTLNLSADAHIQTAENFAKGNIATHNYISKKQLQHNYDRYVNTKPKQFRDEYVNPGMNAVLPRAGILKKKGVDTVTDIYTGKQISTSTKLDNGKNNPDAAQREHVKPSAELYKNASLQMANGDQELADIINNPNNLQGYTTAARNNRKNDKSADEMSEEDKTKYWKKADQKAGKYIKQKEKEGEERLKKEGQKTQKEEFFRISDKALRTAVMAALATLLKKIMSKLVLWLKAREKTLRSLMDSMKEAILSFVRELKGLVVNTASSVFTTIATSIVGPVVGVIKKVVPLLRQGWSSLKEVVQYLRAPANRGRPLKYLIPEIGKIVMAGLAGVGAIFLGEEIENALVKVPFMAVEIPLLGNLANIIGIFMGAIVCGILGAIALHWIDKLMENRQKRDNLDRQIDKQNEMLSTQSQLMVVERRKTGNAKRKLAQSVVDGHRQARKVIEDSLEAIYHDNEDDDEISDRLDEIDADLNDLLD